MKVQIDYNFTLTSDDGETAKDLIDTIKWAALHLSAASDRLKLVGTASADIAVLLLGQMESTVNAYAANIERNPGGFVITEDRTCGRAN